MERTNYQSDLSADENLLMSVVRAAEIFKRIVSTIFRKYNLSFPQYNVLRVVDSSRDIGWPIQAILPSLPTRNAAGMPFCPAASIQVSAMAPFSFVVLSSMATR